MCVCSVREIELLDAASEDEIRVPRIGRDRVVLPAGREDAELHQVDPVALGRAAGNGGGARVLLRAVHRVGEAVVRRDAVELPGRLVVPGAPGLAAVQRHDGALVDAEHAAFGVLGVDPELVVIVPAGGALDRRKRAARVLRPVERGVARVDDVGVARLDRDPAEVPAASPDPRIVARERPARTVVVGAVEPAALGVHHGVDALRPARRDREPDAARAGRKAAAADLRPRPPAVRRFVQAAARPVRRRVDVPGRPARLPESRVHDAGIARLEREIDGAGVLVAVEHALPDPAPVGGEKDAALGVGAVGMAESRDQDPIRVAGVDQDSPDLLRVPKPDVDKGLPAVGGFVHPVALRDVGAHVGLAGAHVDHLRIRRRQGERADGADRLGVEDRSPGPAGIVRLPHAAVDAAEVEVRHVAGHAGHGQHAPPAKRADRAPAEL